MSVYEVGRFCHMLVTDASHRQRARTALPDALAEFEMTEDERRALLDGDVSSLLYIGVHPLLVVRLQTYGIAGLDEATYSARVRAGLPLRLALSAPPAQPPGRACLVTGATGGLGSHLTRVFRAAGDLVFATGRDEDALRRVAAEPAAGQVRTLAADLTSADEVRRLGDEIRREVDGLDVVVVAAGQTVRGTFVDPSDSLSRWRDVILLNVFGTAAVARETLSLLVARRGTLVLVGSVAAQTVVPGDLYSVSKHAIAALAEAIRLEAEPLGVRVCVVHPGLIDTPMVSADRRSRPMLHPGDVAEEIARICLPDSPIHTTEVVMRPAPSRTNLSR